MSMSYTYALKQKFSEEGVGLYEEMGLEPISELFTTDDGWSQICRQRVPDMQCHMQRMLQANDQRRIEGTSCIVNNDNVIIAIVSIKLLLVWLGCSIAMILFRCRIRLLYRESKLTSYQKLHVEIFCRQCMHMTDWQRQNSFLPICLRHHQNHGHNGAWVCLFGLCVR